MRAVRTEISHVENRFATTGSSLYDTDDKWSLELESLARIIEFANQNNIARTLFLNPYHYTYLENIRDSGYWREFESLCRT